MITNKEWIMRIDQLLIEVIKSKTSSIPPHLNTEVAMIKQIKYVTRRILRVLRKTEKVLLVYLCLNISLSLLIRDFLRLNRTYHLMKLRIIAIKKKNNGSES